MATQDDVRRIALALPGVTEDPNHFSFAVAHRGKPKGIAWAWMERVEPKRPKVPNLDVLAVAIPDVALKEMLNDPAKFVEDPHYAGYPAVLVRLAAVDADELEALLTEAWRCKAPAALRKQ